jgi:glycosyltransferase involved in cell wall biosynthesis
MRVLNVCSGNHPGLSPFITEQMDTLSQLGVEVSLFQIKSKGVFGYLSHINKLTEVIKEFKPDLIHGHYGYSGFIAVIQSKKPVVITYHGSDVNEWLARPVSFLASRLAKANIFVSIALREKLTFSKGFVIPCGVDINFFKPMHKKEALTSLGLNPAKKYLLFSSAFSNPVKNYLLAKRSVNLLNSPTVEMLELNNYSRQDVVFLLNACEAVLLTSFSEGSPQVIKEAMACNCPIVSTCVGDVKWVLNDTDGCYIASYDPNDFTGKLRLVLEFSEKHGRTNGRLRIIELGLDSETVAKKIVAVYEKVLSDKRK